MKAVRNVRIQTVSWCLASLGLITLGIRPAQAQNDFTGQEKAMMIEAARLDLYSQLAQEIKGIQLDSKSVVNNHVLAEGVTQAVTEALVRGVREGEAKFINDVVLLEGEITLQQVVENLKRLEKVVDGFKVLSTEDIHRYNQEKTIKRVGRGTRPGTTPRAGTTLADNGLVRTIEALEGTGQEKLGACRAAEIDALALLARQIKGVRISDDSCVFNMALDNRWTEATSKAVIRGAKIVRYDPMGKDAVVCTMDIGLQQVVENVNRHTEVFNDRMTSTETITRYNPGLVVITARGYGAIASVERPVSTSIPGEVR